MQPLHALLKAVPLDKLTAGKEVSPVQLCHALVKLMSSPASVLNVTTGKVVKLALLQPYHALVKLVPLDRFNAGKEVNPVQPYHALEKFVPLDKSSVGKEGSPVHHFHARVKSVPLDKSNKGNEVSPLQDVQLA